MLKRESRDLWIYQILQIGKYLVLKNYIMWIVFLCKLGTIHAFVIRLESYWLQIWVGTV